MKIFSNQLNLYIFAENNTIETTMKLFITIIASLLFATNCYSQITAITAKDKEESEVEVQKYDSLESLNSKNVLLHEGQTLFLKGTKYAKENNYYYIFFTKIIPEGSWDNDPYVYKPIAGKGRRIVSSYSELVGKYYKVLSIQVDKANPYHDAYWLQLVGDDETPFYFHMERETAGFITLGYYEKMKQIFVGKEFYSISSMEHPKVDSKETTKAPHKTKFKCIDIAVNIGESDPPFAVLENTQYGKIKGQIIKGQRLHMFVSISAYNEYIKKYGTKFGSLVAEGDVIIGMNKKMVKDAWGLPDHINTTTGSYGTHEQWVYGSSYLYFKNGIVTSKQE